MAKRKRLKSLIHLAKLMNNYYKESETTDKKIAWVTSGAPVELLLAFDIFPLYPENYGAYCGTTRKTPELSEAIEGLGYSQDICSYARASIGSMHTGKHNPLRKPDLVYSCNNICHTVVKWYEHVAEYYNIPHIFIDTPFIYDDYTDSIREYVKNEIYEAIEELEKLTKTKLNQDKLIEIMELSEKTVKLWRDIEFMGKAKPSPISCEDLFMLMAPIVAMRGFPEAYEFYKMVYEELGEYKEKGIGFLEEEKYRLLWDNIAIWYAYKDLFKLFYKRGANIVIDTYTASWYAEFKGDDPIDALAYAYTMIYLNRNLFHKIENTKWFIKEFSIDGFVFHGNRSCKPYSIGQFIMKEKLQEMLGIPGLIIEADMTDYRFYNEAWVENRVEAFLDMLEKK